MHYARIIYLRYFYADDLIRRIDRGRSRVSRRLKNVIMLPCSGCKYSVRGHAPSCANLSRAPEPRAQGGSDPAYALRTKCKIFFINYRGVVVRTILDKINDVREKKSSLQSTTLAFQFMDWVDFGDV